MSTRTIIEINHDYLEPDTLEALLSLWHTLPSSEIAGLLNKSERGWAYWNGCGIRVLAQRHHSDTIKLEVS